MKARLLTLFVLFAILFVGFSFPEEAQASQVRHTALPSASSSGCTTVHIVKRGEYLKLIAARYGTTVYALVQLNGLSNPNLIYPGQKLTVPVACPQPQPPSGNACYKTYVVKRGEYLKLIANRYGTTVSAIVAANGLRNPNLIYPGQKLKIPVVCPKPTPKPPAPSKGAWTGKYWANRWFSGDPKYTRNTDAINFNWGTKGPGNSIGGTNFAVRWKRSRYFDAGNYRFHVKTDDGVRVWLDGIPIIDQWRDQAPSHFSADRQLSAGNHNLRVDYYQNQGGAQIKFWIERIGDGAAWKGEFYNNVELKGAPSAVRYRNAIDFDWGKKSPVPGVISADYFSARFTGKFPFAGGAYRFVATADDGIRVWVDDNLIIDQWHLTSARTYVVDVDVAEGDRSLKVEYFENTGAAVCKLRWTQR